MARKKAGTLDSTVQPIESVHARDHEVTESVPAPTRRKRQPAKQKKNLPSASSPCHIQVQEDAWNAQSQNVPINAGLSPEASHKVTIFGKKFQLALRQTPVIAFTTTPGISRVARLAGISFVAIGGFFALFNFQALSSHTLQSGMLNLATTGSLSPSVCDPMSQYYNTEQCSNLTTLYPTGTSGSAEGSTESSNTEPVLEESPVDFAIDIPASGYISGDINIYISVENALRVHVSAYKDGDITSIGDATLQQNDTWVVTWHTAGQDPFFEDGDYRLKATVIQDSVHSYTRSDDKYVRVLNQVTTESEEGGETVTESGTSTESATVPTTVQLEVPPSPLKGTQRITAIARGADAVKIYAKNSTLGTDIFLGYAYEEDDDTGEWRYSFVTNTSKTPDGMYEIRAVAFYDSTSITSGRIQRQIQNLTTSQTTTTSTTSTATTGTSTTQTSPTTYPTDIQKLEAVLTVRSSSPIRDTVDVRIDVESAQFVEVYAVPKLSFNSQFIGLASRIDTNRWNLRWNTRNAPNGEYVLFARVKNSYGVYDSARVSTTVYNSPITTDITNATKTTVTTDTQINETVTPILKSEPTVQEEISAIAPDTPDEGDESEDVDEVVVSAEDQALILTREILEEFSDRIEDEIDRLRSAIRSGDADAIQRAKNRLYNLRNDIMESALARTDTNSLVSTIDSKISELFSRIESSTEKTELIVKERVGDEIKKDSDSDGIADYDEINLFNTDPMVADTDNDGFIDGEEILNGYNPNDATPEVVVAYESPKDQGVVHEEILKVESVTAIPLETDEGASDGVVPQALITGKALPNSFVTIYIFSTPIVVTVKTNDDGSWSYMFDKELEDGEHEVYVGITDNTGRIVAKSNPFVFVKTAEAFTPVAAQGSTGSPEKAEPSFFANNLILIILSIAVVALGLVLMFLGVYSENRHKRLTAMAPVIPQRADSV